MKKEETIKRYGKAAYEKYLQQTRDWRTLHPEEVKVMKRKWCTEHPENVKAYNQKWGITNPEKVKAKNQEHCRKGGKYYESTQEYNLTGLQGERNKIRKKHNYLYYEIKQATPNSVFHHEWLPGTAEYRGVALVDKELHQNGIIKVIKVLEGQITVFTEKEIKEQEEKEK